MLKIRFHLLRTVRIMLCVSACLAAANAMPESESIPPDLAIYLASAPRHASVIPGGHSVTIDAKGNALLSGVESPTGPLPEMQVTLSQEDMEDIWSWIQKERFFELDSEYRDENIMGGDFAEMEITANGKTHKVLTINMRVYAFDRISVVIGHYLPEGRRIQYNALYAPQYQSVER